VCYRVDARILTPEMLTRVPLCHYSLDEMGHRCEDESGIVNCRELQYAGPPTAFPRVGGR